MDIISYILSRKYTDNSLIGLGALKGANCTVKDIVHQDGINTVTFEWEGTDGTKKTRDMVVYDGTPIYVWESGNTYHYGDLAIYESQFYRCIIENSDVTFDNTKWNEIGSPDGNYDIVQSKDLLPARFTAADRKLYFIIDECIFYLWDGTQWVAQTHLVQESTMPIASAKYLSRIYQYVGVTNANFVHGLVYECVSDGQSPATYSWQELATTRVEMATQNTLGIVKGGKGTTINNEGGIDVDVNEFIGTQAQWDALTTAQQNQYDIVNITGDQQDLNLGQYLRKVSIMPNAEDAPSETVLYVGATTSNYTQGFTYRSVPVVESGVTTYHWESVFGTAAQKGYTDNVRPNSHDLVESNAVYNAISSSIASIYKPHGSLTCAQLTSDLLIAANIGNVYNMTDSGTTSALFIQGAGKTINVNDTVGIIQADNNAIMFNLMGSMIDLHEYQKQELTTPMTIGGTTATDVEDALDALNDVKATQFTTMPTASVDYVGEIVQYIGDTTSSYTQGYWYRCVSDGAVSPTYSWVEATDYVTSTELETRLNGILYYDTMPSVAEMFAMNNNTVFFTKGYYSIGDGCGGYYKVSTSTYMGALKITQNSTSRFVIALNDNCEPAKDVIEVCRYGVKSYVDGINFATITEANTYADINSDVITNLYLPKQKSIIKFPNGRFFFADPLEVPNSRQVSIIGENICSDINDRFYTSNDRAGFTALYFPFLTNGQYAIKNQNNVENLMIIGNPLTYNITFDRTQLLVDTTKVVTETIATDNGEEVKCTGIITANGKKCKNLFVAYFYTGIQSPIGNIHYQNIEFAHCHFGLDIQNDAKCIGIYGSYMHTLITTKGSLISVANARVDSAVNVLRIIAGDGCIFDDIDGDWVTDSLILFESGSTNSTISSSFTNIHGRCCILNYYDSDTENPPKISDLSNTQGYGIIRVGDNTTVQNCYFLIPKNHGRAVDNTARYQIPQIILTHGTSTTIKDNTIVSPCPTSFATEPNELFETNGVTGFEIKYDNLYNIYHITNDGAEEFPNLEFTNSELLAMW